MIDDILLVLFSNPNKLGMKQPYGIKKDTYFRQQPEMISSVYPSGELQIPSSEERTGK